MSSSFGRICLVKEMIISMARHRQEDEWTNRQKHNTNLKDELFDEECMYNVGFISAYHHNSQPLFYVQCSMKATPNDLQFTLSCASQFYICEHLNFPGPSNPLPSLASFMSLWHSFLCSDHRLSVLRIMWTAKVYFFHLF